MISYTLDDEVLQNCENCGSDQLETFQIEKDHRLLFCTKCLLYQKGTLPHDELYQESKYHLGYYSRRSAKIRTALIRLASVTKYLPTNSIKMLDVGCSIGATVAAGKRMGWESMGVDVSQSAVDFCREHGLDCHSIDNFKLPFPDNSFDLLTSWHVIEHVMDVRQTLDEWMRVVRPGGILILETPDSQCFKARRLGAKYKKFWPEGHLYTFTRSNMCSLLRQSGFEILPSRILGKLGTLPIHLTAYAAAYRSWRKLNRKFGFCKSIEVCCRKSEAQSNAVARKANKTTGNKSAA